MDFFLKAINLMAPAKTAADLPWSEGLQGMDDLSAIESAAQQLNKDFHSNRFCDEAHVLALLAIDDKIHTKVKTITTHFMQIDNLSMSLEERMVEAVFLYHRQIFLIYLALAEAPVRFKQSSLLLARAINSATQMIKWRYYNYQTAPANVWLQLSRLYKLGADQGVINDNVQAYTDQPAITLASAYIQACMLGSLENLSLKCQQIEFVSQMLSIWSSNLVVENNYNESQHLFYIDTASNTPARRVNSLVNNPEQLTSNCYWNFDSVNSKVELCISLIEFNIDPRQPAIQALLNNKNALATLQILRQAWSGAVDKNLHRKEARSKFSQAANTAYGFKAICMQALHYEKLQLEHGKAPYQGPKTLDERLATHYLANAKTEAGSLKLKITASNTDIIDASTKGVGLHASQQAHAVSLGMLLGIVVAGSKHATKIGILRNIKSIPGNELRLGVELLSSTAVYVSAEKMDAPLVTMPESFSASTYDDAPSFSYTDFGSDPSNFTCLHLAADPFKSIAETLVIPRQQYSKKFVYKVNINGTDTLIKFTKSLEWHEDWVRVIYSNVNDD